jgi:hypothetical protein
LIPAYLDAARDEKELIGLWLGGERWLRSHGRLISAFVFFHFREEGEAVISIRAENQRVPHRVYGRWWVEGDDLVLALGAGDIRAPYAVSSSILYWADEVLVRRPMGKHNGKSSERAAPASASASEPEREPDPDPPAQLTAQLAD